MRIFEPEHELANADGYVLEHRKVLYDAGIEVASKMHVHHINEDKSDNRLANLAVKTPKDHVRGHLAERGGLRVERCCERCGKSFMPWKRSGRYCSRSCSNRRHV